MKVWRPILPPFKKYKKDVFKKAGLVGNFIYQIGEYKKLREVSTEIPVHKITSKEYQKKFKYLKNCLLKYRQITGMGRGITAVQTGIPERFSVIYLPENKDLLIIINPKVIKASDKKYLYPEMCMSANPIIAPTIRPTWIEFEYFDENGNKQIWATKDDTPSGKILNRVFQHEIDHMEGVINIDLCHSRDLILDSDPKFYDSAKFEEVK